MIGPPLRREDENQGRPTAPEAANEDIELAADGQSQQQQQQQQIRKRLHTNDTRGAFHRTGSSLNPVPEAASCSFFTEHRPS